MGYWDHTRECFHADDGQIYTKELLESMPIDMYKTITTGSILKPNFLTNANNLSDTGSRYDQYLKPIPEPEWDDPTHWHKVKLRRISADAKR